MALSEYPGVPGSDYMNANFIKGASGSNAYIACQGPLPHTVNDFWRMVVECEVQVIVMACNEQEAGKHKCEKYWKDENDDLCNERSAEMTNQHTATYGKYEVTLLKSREICPDFLVRTMRLRWKNEDSGNEEDKAKSKKMFENENSNDSHSMTENSDMPGMAETCHSPGVVSSSSEYYEERTVCQFHYSAWPDHGIPLHVKPLLEMVRLIRDCQASETLPVLIHCSAGCGRTGTICAIDFIWGLLRTGKLSEDFSLYSLVREMRKQRIAMVQTVDQYILVHRAVKELFLEQLKVIDAHPYENVDDDGHPISIYKSSDGNEPIVPDYETIFVKGNDHNVASSTSSTTSNSNMCTAVDFDRILNQKMLQTQLHQQNDAYNHREARDSEEASQDSDDSPPNPPPKQRNILDSKAIDTRQLEISDSLPVQEDPVAFPTPELVLFDPPASKNAHENNQKGFTTSSANNLGPQKFKKGKLRLTQTEDGAWKLQELESELPDLSKDTRNVTQSQSLPLQQVKKDTRKTDSVAASKKVKGKKEKKTSPSKGLDESDSPKAGELLRKPSIKKIRAFFNKEKPQQVQHEQTSPSTSSSSSTTCLDQSSVPTDDLKYIQTETVDHDISMAISKLPKLDQKRHSGQVQVPDDPSKMANNISNSKSVPNSLDRRVYNTSSVPKSPGESKRSIENSTSGEIGLRSKSSERIPANNQESSMPPATVSSYNSFSSSLVTGSGKEKPLLPVKRSKSMRASSMSPPSTAMTRLELSSGTNNTVNDDTRQGYDGNNKLSNMTPRENRSYCDTNSFGIGVPSTTSKQYFGLPIKDAQMDGLVGPKTLSNGETRCIEAAPSPPPKPKRSNSNNNSPEYANVRIPGVGSGNNSTEAGIYKNASNDASRSYSMTDFNRLKHQLVNSADNFSSANGDSMFLESHLLKLHARKESSGHNQTPEDSNKRTLKDCQDYLMASFDMAEKEGERLVTGTADGMNMSKRSAAELTSPSRTSLSEVIRTNRSAESSPIATMQKKSLLQHREQLFSSHSSPSSSYNKYKASHSPLDSSTSLDKTPPSRSIKSLSSSSYARSRNNHLSPNAARTFETTDTRNLSKNSGIVRSKDNMALAGYSNSLVNNSNNQYENIQVSSSTNQGGNDYSVVAMEAQRKVSEAVVAGGPKARARRNSFREAVESKGEKDNKKDDDKGESRFPKKPYESIWFGKGGEGRPDDEINHKDKLDAIDGQSRSANETRRNAIGYPEESSSKPPIYVNTVVPSSKSNEIHQRHYDNLYALPAESKPSLNPASVSTGGYETVNFKDGKVSQAHRNTTDEFQGNQANGKLTPPGGLQCVSLVNEIMSTNPSLNSTKPCITNISPSSNDGEFSQSPKVSNTNKGALRKQTSNGSVASTGSSNSAIGNKGPPPPYKQPPRVATSNSFVPQHTLMQNRGVHHPPSSISQIQSPPYQNIPIISHISPQHQRPVQVNYNTAEAGIRPANKTGIYANVSVPGHNQGKF